MDYFYSKYSGLAKHIKQVLRSWHFYRCFLYACIGNLFYDTTPNIMEILQFIVFALPPRNYFDLLFAGSSYRWYYSFILYTEKIRRGQRIFLMSPLHHHLKSARECTRFGLWEYVSHFKFCNSKITMIAVLVQERVDWAALLRFLLVITESSKKMVNELIRNGLEEGVHTESKILSADILIKVQGSRNKIDSQGTCQRHKFFQKLSLLRYARDYREQRERLHHVGDHAHYLSYGLDVCGNIGASCSAFSPEP